jgi:hypothetical protein
MRNWINELRDQVKIINHNKVSSKLIAVCEALNTLDDSQFNIQHYKWKEGGTVTYCPLGWAAEQIPSLGLKFLQEEYEEGSYQIVDDEGNINIDAVCNCLGISLFDYVDVFSEYSYRTGRSDIVPTKKRVMRRIFRLAMEYRVQEDE